LIENGTRNDNENRYDVRCSTTERRVYVKDIEIKGSYTEQTLALYPSTQQA
jgi:hypothetical protein